MQEVLGMMSAGTAAAFEVAHTKRGRLALNKSFGGVDGCETGH